MPSAENTNDQGFQDLMAAASELIPLLDRSILRLRYTPRAKTISPLEYRILDFVCHHQPVRIGGIGEMSGLSFPNASRYVKDLIRRGYLVSAPDAKDKRAQAISLGPGARAVLDAVEAAIWKEAKELFDRLAPRDAQALEQACRQLGAALLPLVRSLET